jgi:hypothetical protein
MDPMNCDILSELYCILFLIEQIQINVQLNFMPQYHKYIELDLKLNSKWTF